MEALVVPWWSGASHNKGRLNEEEEKEKEDGEGEDGGCIQRDIQIGAEI